MYKKGITTAIWILLMIVIVACSDNGGGQSDSNNSSSSNQKDKVTNEQVTIRFGYYGGEGRQKKYAEMIADFEKKNPDIKIEQEFADPVPFYDRLATQVAGGNAPDVITMQIGRFNDYAGRGLLFPLNDLVQSKVIDLSDFEQKMIDVGKLNDDIVMVANGNTSRGLFYNSELFKQVGVEPPHFDISWEEFAAKGAEFKQAVNNPNVYFSDDPTGIDAGAEIVGYFMRQKGKDLYNEEGKFAFDKQDLIEWFQYWDNLRNDGIIPPAALVAEYRGKAPQESMIAKGITAVNLSAGAINQMSIFQPFVKGELEITRVPVMTGGKPGEELGGIFFSIYAKSKHPNEAARFIDYLVNDVDGAKIFKVEVGPSPSEKINDAVASILEPEVVKVNEYQNKVKDLFTIPVTPPPGNNDVFKQMTIASEAIAFKKKTIEQAVDDFFSEAEKILK